VLYGSDGALPPAYTPKKAWEAFRQLPLDDAEFRIIANNRAPYMADAPAGARLLVPSLHR
jgi:hypothetical protein